MKTSQSVRVKIPLVLEEEEFEAIFLSSGFGHLSGSKVDSGAVLAAYAQGRTPATIALSGDRMSSERQAVHHWACWEATAIQAKVSC
ncbi:hypothetical protein Y1Q_0023660 [Alligator mississippiensis]|uniref:Uncharacterized protein n=1 Tax=Alligator mississippiensis TaxID=8496 RepID=A0A151MMW8_ALLMI|nr:hypothetical protein Y1Q_0023660 [Alligator mississippiensis]